MREREETFSYIPVWMFCTSWELWWFQMASFQHLSKLDILMKPFASLIPLHSYCPWWCSTNPPSIQAFWPNELLSSYKFSINADTSQFSFGRNAALETLEKRLVKKRKSKILLLEIHAHFGVWPEKHIIIQLRPIYYVCTR